ncbi:histidinol-phosphatase HisJ family protein [Ornithinibacillus sp. 179-J 7C1 HS]|uniref:histidinol-phosphatase HisJ family protein n=1 Tax=Ornithinibacillus sp. 179-J 7C1 HS TaxID=3142384 RepID=UPI0039A1B0F0
MFDYHIHSDFSADCKTPMELTIQKGIEIGLEEICFTEHIDYDYPDPSIIFEFDLEAYNREIKRVQKKYQNQIRIKKGIEIGVEPHLLERYKKLMRNENFDFVICSMHTSDRTDLHSGEFFENRTVEEAYATYYRELLYCVKEFEDFSVLGHLDLVKRYKRGSKYDFHEVITEILKVVIEKGKGIELNTSGFRYGLNSAMPSTDILQLYRNLGGKIITIGSDSHIAETVGFEFRTSLELLGSLGFNYIATYENGEPSFHYLGQL